MRAIIKCTTSIEQEKLQALLKKTSWLPRLGPESPIVLKFRQEIINSVSSTDHDMVEASCVFDLYDEDSSTWGLVNHPNDGKFTFRLKNSKAPDLKAACERLVLNLMDSKEPIIIEDTIDVLEANNQEHAFQGRVLPKNRFRYAFKHRQLEAVVGVVALALAILLLLLTSPFIGISSTDAWGLWLTGVMGRLATSALVTFTVTWTTVFLHWLTLRRKPVVQW